jgi:fumarate hydratase subunit alpha
MGDKSDETILKETVIELIRKANTELPKDIVAALKSGYENEKSDIARMQLRAILDNIELSRTMKTPMCQDTGIPIFFVKLGSDGMPVHIIEKAILDGTREATESVPLRPNAVHPFTRANPGNNVGDGMPAIKFKPSKNSYTEIAFMPKGAGSENMSALAMLQPSQGLRGIKKFILDTVLSAGSKPCPPIVVGVGIGGSADIAMGLSKESLLRDVTKRHSDAQIAGLESELLSALNDTGIGPMGLGGKTTVLGLNIEYSFCHLASLPVGVNIQCWAARRSAARIHPGGKVEYFL